MGAGDTRNREEPKTFSIDHPFPISKLRAVPRTVRFRLKSRGITTCAQLLAAAALAERRLSLLDTTDIDAAVLLVLVRRADMARINGIGTIFGLMLENVGIFDIERLAMQDPAALHGALRRYNLEEHLARRSPTLEEVEGWIADARRLPIIVTNDNDRTAAL